MKLKYKTAGGLIEYVSFDGLPQDCPITVNVSEDGYHTTVKSKGCFIMDVSGEKIESIDVDGRMVPIQELAGLGDADMSRMAKHLPFRKGIEECIFIA